jgi:hypothetical protein
MTPTDYAAAELELWQEALREQRDAEEQLRAHRRGLAFARVLQLRPEVEALRTRSDLLLAEAVKVKCAFRDNMLRAAATTSPLLDVGHPMGGAAPDTR